MLSVWRRPTRVNLGELIDSARVSIDVDSGDENNPARRDGLKKLNERVDVSTIPDRISVRSPFLRSGGREDHEIVFRATGIVRVDGIVEMSELVLSRDIAPHKTCVSKQC
ncbi:hypothetical protein GCM10009792_22200 [Microcella alkalica]